MKLFYNGIVRDVNSEQAENLLRKGWVECVDNPPSFNAITEKLIAGDFTIIDGKAIRQYSIETLPISEQKTNTFNAAIESGFDTGLGYKLALYPDDREAFNQMATLLREGEDIGVFLPDNPIPIKDMNGVKHTVTVSQFRQLVVAYGVHFAALWENK